MGKVEGGHAYCFIFAFQKISALQGWHHTLLVELFCTEENRIVDDLCHPRQVPGVRTLRASQLFWHGICSALEYGQEIARMYNRLSYRYWRIFPYVAHMALVSPTAGPWRPNAPSIPAMPMPTMPMASKARRWTAGRVAFLGRVKGSHEQNCVVDWLITMITMVYRCF